MQTLHATTPTVVTYQAPCQSYGYLHCKIRLCARHIERRKADTWPKCAHGVEYCQVSAGMHRDDCDDCLREEE